MDISREEFVDACGVNDYCFSVSYTRTACMTLNVNSVLNEALKRLC